MLYRIRKVVVGMFVVGSMNHGMLGAEGMTQKLRKTGKKPCSGGDCATDAKSSKAIQVESHTQTNTKMSTMAHMWQLVQTKYLMMMSQRSFVVSLIEGLLAVAFVAVFVVVALGAYAVRYKKEICGLGSFITEHQRFIPQFLRGYIIPSDAANSSNDDKTVTAVNTLGSKPKSSF